MKHREIFIPEGWCDNSPAVHCWDEGDARQSGVPEGRLKHLSSLRDSIASNLGRPPSDESLGYSRTSLRDGSPRHSARRPGCYFAVVAICAFLLGLPGFSFADETAQSELDAQLLEDLGGDLFEDAADPDETELDEDLRRSLGEDLGQSSPADDPHSPLERIGTQMRSAQQLLAERDGAGRATRLQDQIVKDLDALIKKAQRQKKQSQQGGKPSGGSQRPDARPQGGQPGDSSAEGQQPAADSTEGTREGAGEASTADRDAGRSELLKNLWGHLPERVRQQMLQSPDDEFLPKYEFEIEQYFRRLAEDPDLDGTR